MTMIIITASIRTRPETHDHMVTIGKEHSARSRLEPGCIAHNFHIDCETPDRLVFVELWADVAAVETHFAVPATAALARDMRSLGATVPDLRIFKSDELEAPRLTD